MADHEFDEVYILDTDLVVKAYINFWANLKKQNDQFTQQLKQHTDRFQQISCYCNMTDDGTDVEISRRLGEAFCINSSKKYGNWDNVNLYVDTAFHWRNHFGLRPAFLQLLEDARDGKIDLIITAEMDRFAESVEELLEITEELRLLPHPILVWFEKEGISSDGLHEFLQLYGYPEYYRKRWKGLRRKKRD